MSFLRSSSQSGSLRNTGSGNGINFHSGLNLSSISVGFLSSALSVSPGLSFAHRLSLRRDPKPWNRQSDVPDEEPRSLTRSVPTSECFCHRREGWRRAVRRRDQQREMKRTLLFIPLVCGWRLKQGFGNTF